jgi:NAD(P)-dependent dehydrogenase (short-subunit alcohol dehydrogenase family)
MESFSMKSIHKMRKIFMSTNANQNGFQFSYSEVLLPRTESKNFVISTSSRGLGLEFTKQLLNRSASNCKVIGLCRAMSPALEDLHVKFPGKLAIVFVNLEDDRSIAFAAKTIADKIDKIDLLLNVAGILGDGKLLKYHMELYKVDGMNCN